MEDITAAWTSAGRAREWSYALPTGKMDGDAKTRRGSKNWRQLGSRLNTAYRACQVEEKDLQLWTAGRPS